MKGTIIVDISSRLSLSYYKEIGYLDPEHSVSLVQHTVTNHVFVKKTIDIYNKAIYEFIKRNPVKGIPVIYELLENQGQLIIIEEYISGNTLDEMLESGSHFTEEQVRHILIKLCDVLYNLHNCEPAIIHRDIKPSNIIIRPNGDLVLIDLNAAKYQSSGKEEDTRLLGTKGYAAPEQYGFGTSNVRTDIYALGMLANTLLIGRFSQSVIENSSLTPIIKKCTQLRPEDRYSNVNGIKLRLTNINGIKYRHEWQRYLPPGFRSLKPLNIVVSTIIYALIIRLCTTLEIKNTNNITLSIDRIFTLFIFLGVILFTCNYCSVQDLFSPCRTKNRILKLIAIIIMDFIIAVILLVLMALLNTIFSH